MVISRSAAMFVYFTAPVDGSADATLTSSFANAGMYRDTGSVSRNLPSSTSIIAATEVYGLVIEYRRKIASLVIGLPLAGSSCPKVSK